MTKSSLQSMSSCSELSVISPVYMSASIVAPLVENIACELKQLGITYEIILVEDGSKDQSWQSILKECSRSEHVKGIKLSRNFGQHIAITAGLEHARGNWIIIMDCDLQDNPEEIKRLYTKALEG